MSSSSRLRVALATSAHLPDLDDDSVTMVEPLRALGVEPVPASWDDASVDWASFDLCLIRSTWDYYERRDAYVAWAARADEACALWNPPDVVLWNTDKSYLRTFEQAGIRIVPTRWLAAGEHVPLGDLAADLGASDLIVKPCVSAGAARTFRVDATQLDAGEEILGLLAGQALMVQPYFRRIETDGETSLIYLGGRYSHSIRKVPRPGDFRCQEEWGGDISAVEPAPGEREMAEAVLARVASRLAYARVDVVPDAQGRPCLTELEIVEPSLYLRYSEGAAVRLARHVRDLLP